MHLHCRFLCTNEFEEEEEDVDFRKNKTWFDNKFVTEYRSTDRNKIIYQTGYYKAIGKACGVLGIPTMHKVHLGRVLGSCESNVNEDPSDDL